MDTDAAKRHAGGGATGGVDGAGGQWSSSAHMPLSPLTWPVPSTLPSGKLARAQAQEPCRACVGAPDKSLCARFLRRPHCRERAATEQALAGRSESSAGRDSGGERANEPQTSPRLRDRASGPILAWQMLVSPPRRPSWWNARQSHCFRSRCTGDAPLTLLPSARGLVAPCRSLSCPVRVALHRQRTCLAATCLSPACPLPLPAPAPFCTRANTSLRSPPLPQLLPVS